MAILEPHPTDVQRVFRAATCAAGRAFGGPLDQSTKQGDAWTPIFNPKPFESLGVGYPVRLVGGQGAAAARFYLVVNRDHRLGGSTLFRSDDDGSTWTAVLAYRGGGSSGYAQPETIRLRRTSGSDDAIAPFQAALNSPDPIGVCTVWNSFFGWCTNMSAELPSAVVSPDGKCRAEGRRLIAAIGGDSPWCDAG